MSKASVSTINYLLDAVEGREELEGKQKVESPHAHAHAVSKMEKVNRRWRALMPMLMLSAKWRRRQHQTLLLLRVPTRHQT